MSCLGGDLIRMMAGAIWLGFTGQLMAGTIPFPAALDAAAVVQPAITNLQKNGLVIGNGELNAIVYASGNQLRLRVCKNDAWDGRIVTASDPALPKINAAAGTFTGTIGAQASWNKNAYPNAVPCVELSLAAAGGQTAWTNSVLDLAKAKVAVSSDADTTVIRTLAQTNAFLIQSARPLSFVGVNQVVSNSPGSLGGVGPSGLISGWVTNVITGRTNGYSYARQIIYGDADASGMDIYCVAGVSGTNQAVAVVTSRDSLTPLADAVAMVTGVLADANAISTHEAVWQDFWAASGVQIGDATMQNWWYRMMYYNRCFATAGVNCYGLKAGQDMISGWHGCPKINYNIQQAYCLGGPVNHPEFIQPFVDAMNRNLPRARWLATNTFVGVTEGAFFHSDWWPFEPDPLGCTTPNRHQLAYLPWGFSWGMSGHAVFNLWEFYQYQPTTNALNRIWPSLSEIGKFYCALLEQCPLVNGKRRLAPSFYPEEGSFGHTNSCYDIVWIKYTLNAARQAAGLMGDITFSNRCATNLALLPAYTTVTDSSQGDQTVIENWLGAGLLGAVNVAGEVMPVFPAEEVTWFSDQATKDLYARTIQHDESVTAHINSNVTLNMARARLSLTNVISNLYFCFATNSSISPQQPNGLFFWNGHGYYIAEQMAIARVVSELLMQSAGDIIRIFPAWPASADGHFRNLRARGGFLVSADQVSSVVTNLTITSTLGGDVRILYPWVSNSASPLVSDAAGNRVACSSALNQVLTFPTITGMTYTLWTTNRLPQQFVPEAAGVHGLRSR